jgi:Ca-activated chloride channel homolog
MGRYHCDKSGMLWILLLLFSSNLRAQVVENTAPMLSVSVRMVEVYAAVLDKHGRHVPGLTPDRFEITQDGRAQQIRLFESHSSALTTALVIDTTASMFKELPRVKNAVINLLGMMKPEDRLGLFTFTTHLNVRQPFTQDRNRVIDALLRTHAAGSTALFDSLTQLSPEVSKVSGKKVILLFTDGDDNSSVITREAAIRNLKKIGVPLYAVAQGEALASRSLMHSLREICQVTGGLVFEVRKPDDLARVFQEIGRDLQNLYLLGYYPSSEDSEPKEWHSISLRLTQDQGLKIRAKEGYWQ